MRSQRVQYKPYDYELDFMGAGGDPIIMIEMSVPESAIVEQASDKIVLNFDGLKHILTVTADAVDEINDKHMKKVKGD